MQSVGRSIRLAKRHQPGPLWVVALFSARPLARAEVHGKLAGGDGHAGGSALPLLLKIDFGQDVIPVVRRFQVVKNPGS